MWLGIIEGISDGLSSIAKLGSGFYADSLPRRKPIALGEVDPFDIWTIGVIQRRVANRFGGVAPVVCKDVRLFLRNLFRGLHSFVIIIDGCVEKRSEGKGGGSVAIGKLTECVIGKGDDALRVTFGKFLIRPSGTRGFAFRSSRGEIVRQFDIFGRSADRNRRQVSE